jgi:hypothetical protein
MAYNTQDEKLLVKGNERITRQLKVQGDIYQDDNKEAVLPHIKTDSIELGDGVVRKISPTAVSGNVTYNATTQQFESSSAVTVSDDLTVNGQLIAGNDLSVAGDLYVNGTEYINNSETSQTSDNYMVLRHGKTTALGSGEYSGLAVHNYSTGKTATIATGNDGEWRIADNTESDTSYTNLSYYNGTYYQGITQTPVTVVDGIKTGFSESELDEVALNESDYYHYDGSNWFEVGLASDKLVVGAQVTDSSLVSTLNSLPRYDLVYFASLVITQINEDENQPLLTRDEGSSLTDKHALIWDATNKKAIDSGVSITKSGATTCVTATTFVGALSGNATTATSATTATNSTCFGGCTYACAKADFRNYTPANATCFSGCTFAQACTTIRSGLTSCTGTVTVSDKAKDDADTPIALCTGATAMGRSTGCALTFNTHTGTLKAKTFCGTLNGDANSANYATCATYAYNAIALSDYLTVSTAAGTAAKAATLEGFLLHKGARLTIRLTNANTVANATLNINDTGAKAVKINGAAVTATNWSAGYWTAYYDGTNWQLSSYEAYNAYTASTAASATVATKIKRTAYTTAYNFDVPLMNGNTSVNSEVMYVSGCCRLNYCNTTGALCITNADRSTVAGSVCAACVKAACVSTQVVALEEPGLVPSKLNLAIVLECGSQCADFKVISNVAGFYSCKAYPAWGIIQSNGTWYKLDYICKVNACCYTAYSGNTCMAGYCCTCKCSTPTVLRAMFVNYAAI